MIRPNEMIVAFRVPKSKPPLLIGFVRKSPNVAPKGLVKIKAIQNNTTLFILEK